MNAQREPTKKPRVAAGLDLAANQWPTTDDCLVACATRGIESAENLSFECKNLTHSEDQGPAGRPNLARGLGPGSAIPQFSEREGAAATEREC